jgi:hypothetical protein
MNIPLISKLKPVKLFRVLPILLLAACAPYQNVMIDAGKGHNAPEEPAICVNPANTQNVVAASNIRNGYYSEDGGKTWMKQEMKSQYGFYGDPCIVADPQGNMYIFHLSDPSGLGWGDERFLDRIVCQRSEDGGKTWTAGSYMGEAHPKDQDKEWTAIDPKNGNIYTTWTQFDNYNSKKPEDQSNILFSMSTDKAETWSEAVQINQFSGDCLDDDGTTEGAVPAVGLNGEIYVSWMLDDKIYFDRSLDAGKTWLDEDLVAVDGIVGWAFDIPGIQRCNGMPITKVDLSNGPNQGTIYINWSDQRNGESDTDIWLIKSTDGGDTWSQPKRVNDDGPGHQQFFTWMDVDQTTGYIYTVFYDRREHDDVQTDVYLAYSKDGGETFQNIKISKKPFTPRDNIFFGDYNNISVYDGVVRPIWTRLDGNVLSVWTALIEVKD